MTAPIPYGGETLVNTTTTNAQKVPQVAALANGNYVVVWQDTSLAPPDASQDSVRAQIFHADGTRLGSEFVLSEFPFAIQQDPVVTALPDGRFVAVWESYNHALEDQSGTHISARIFNPDGTPSTGEFQVNTHTDFWQTKPAIATLDTGGFVITWMHDFVGGNQNYDIFARVYGADGQPISDHDQGVDISTPIERAPVVTGLPGGKFVVAWEDTGTDAQTDGSGSHIRAIIYTGDFQVLNGPSFVVNSTTANDQSDPAIATLSNGNFIVTWTHEFSATDDDVRGRVFNGFGAAQSNDFAIDASADPVQETQSAVAALPNGEYFSVWRDVGGSAPGQTDGSDSHIRGAIMSGNGTAVSGQFIVNTTANGAQGEPQISRLADGRVVVVWTDFGQNGGDTSGAAVRSQILDPRTGPVTLADSGGNDEWVGTAFADTLNGGAGDDILTGGAGTDVLIGGAGIDTAGYVSAVAGLTVDLQDPSANTGDALQDSFNSIENLSGSNFNDILNGDGGANGLSGGDGQDSLRGRGGDDVLNGGAADDKLLGDQGVDDLDGGTGDDVLNGGEGADTMGGGAGNDRYYVDAAADSITEFSAGDGLDTVYASASYVLSPFVDNMVLTGIANLNGTGNEDANKLTGNSGANALSGLGGNDTLDGGTGGDTMAGGTGNDTYYVDNANDVVDETGGDGIDLVYSSRGFSLGNAATALGGIENLTLTGTGSNSGTGNGLDNAITGGSGDNLLKGMDGSDTLKGNDGNDQLLGGNGDDTLTGGNGTDQQTGNVGADKLTGGADADTFFFLSVKDSTIASTGRDTIVDFSSGQGDKIDLSAIDARTDLAGDQAFSFISFAAFSHTAGELRIAASGANLVVSGDTNGDAAADFSILLKNVATASATDFVL